MHMCARMFVKIQKVNARIGGYCKTQQCLRASDGTLGSEKRTRLLTYTKDSA